MHPDQAEPTDFLRSIVAQDQAAGKHGGRVVTRFPPEPNGYLHIGHAKSICINFGIAKEFGGECHLRFDDTNPTKEDQEYVDAIIRDVHWLDWDWGDKLFYASDYFEQMYGWAQDLIRAGLAYVDELSAEEMSAYRGTLTSPGRPSPWRDRPVAENLDLFARMRVGEFPDGSKTLRAKIDLASPNMNLRDPVMYRIMHAHHHRQGDRWCIYPMYDWAQGLNDSIQGVTHSICTLEFENHRPLYDWFLAQLPIHKPRQIEFSRLSLTHTVMSKRKLLELVRSGRVRGWDDPRMPTLSAMRRRGYPAEAIRNFCGEISVNKISGRVELELLEHHVRQVLNREAPRRMAVLDPLKVVLTDWPADKVDWLEAVNNPEDPASGSRQIPFAGTLWIEREDFLENPPKGFFRLAPGREVRLRYGYFIRCQEAIKDEAGRVVELRCTHDPATRGGNAPDGRAVKATLHWVSADHAVMAEVRLYTPLFAANDPEDLPAGQDWTAGLDPHSEQILAQVPCEPALAQGRAGDRIQFERLGYFCVDPDSTPQRPVFNRTVSLKDEWAKLRKRQGT